MPSISLSASLRGQLLTSGRFNPLSIFAASEPGWLYDNSDMSTLFQDSAGTTPVTAVGQPVGLQLDKSKGLVLGPELVTNGDFSAGSTGWALGSGWTIVSGTAKKSTPGTANAVSQSVGVASGKFYTVSFSVSGLTAGSVNVRIGGTATVNFTASANGNYTVTIPSAGLDTSIYFYSGSTFDGSIDNISVKEIAGTHRTQSTAASRPTFARLPVTGRRNLLTYTEQFDNAVWGKSQVSVAADEGMAAYKVTASAGLNSHRLIAAAVTLASGVQCVHSVYMKAGTHSFAQIHDGASISYYANFNLSTGVVGATTGCTATMTDVGSGWYRCSIAMTLNVANPVLCVGVVTSGTSARNESWTAVGTETFFVRKAQLELGSTSTNYQKVVSLYDITEAGVQTAYGLYYDGVDDFLVTPTITPGTDKVQVFAGVRKLSDATRAMVAGLGSGGPLGSFELFAPPATLNGLQFNSTGGTAVGSATVSGYAAPNTSVITGLGDILGDRATLRINGTQVAQATTDQGAGNYNANIVYFGRRGGTTLPFNGYTFREVGRFGPNLDTATIANVENWINQNTGAY